MCLLKRLLPRRRPPKLNKAVRDLARQNQQLRSYIAAENSRLLKDWPTSGGTADADLYAFLKLLRVRSRHLAKNNDYAKRFFNILKTNVVGPTGIGLQARSKNERGELDTADNDYLESEWKEWRKRWDLNNRGASVSGWIFCGFHQSFKNISSTNGSRPARPMNSAACLAISRKFFMKK